jgi:hypothetical protein
LFLCVGIFLHCMYTVQHSCSVCQGKICWNRDLMDACCLLYIGGHTTVYAAAFPQLQREGKRGTTGSSLYFPFLREFLVYVCLQFTVGESKRGTAHVVFVIPPFLKGISRFCLLTIHSWGIEEGTTQPSLCFSIWIFLVFVYSHLTVVYTDTHTMLHSHPDNLPHRKVKMLKETHTVFAFILSERNPTSL